MKLALLLILTKLLRRQQQREGRSWKYVFTAFEDAAAAAGGLTCNAGLLNASSANQFTCDVHPSQDRLGAYCAYGGSRIQNGAVK